MRGTWWERNVPSTGKPSTIFGPVQPLGLLQDDHGPAWAGDDLPLARASCWMRLISSMTRVQCGGHRLVHLVGFVAFDEIWVPAVAFEKFLRVRFGVMRARMVGLAIL